MHHPTNKITSERTDPTKLLLTRRKDHGATPDRGGLDSSLETVILP